MKRIFAALLAMLLLLMTPALATEVSEPEEGAAGSSGGLYGLPERVIMIYGERFRREDMSFSVTPNFYSSGWYGVAEDVSPEATIGLRLSFVGEESYPAADFEQRFYGRQKRRADLFDVEACSWTDAPLTFRAYEEDVQQGLLTAGELHAAEWRAIQGGETVYNPLVLSKDEEDGRWRWLLSMDIFLPDDPALAGVQSVTLRFNETLLTVYFQLVYSGDYAAGPGWKITLLR